MIGACLHPPLGVLHVVTAVHTPCLMVSVGFEAPLGHSHEVQASPRCAGKRTANRPTRVERTWAGRPARSEKELAGRIRPCWAANNRRAIPWPPEQAKTGNQHPILPMHRTSPNQLSFRARNGRNSINFFLPLFGFAKMQQQQAKTNMLLTELPIISETD